MSESSLPLGDWLRIALGWAREAAAIQLDYFSSHDKKIEHKGAIDLVTAADKAVEDYLVTAIERDFPAHDYVAEEGHAKSTGAGLTWYIDPLDGTTNFAHGYPVFCVSIGLVENGVPVLGVVQAPVHGEVFSAVRGGGAFLNGRPLAVSGCDELKQALLVSGFPYAFAKDERNLRLWGAFLHASQAVRRDGSAALDLCYVAAGRYDGFWEMGLNSWDIAAGAIILSEACGSVTNFDGSSLDLDGKNILATNGRLHPAMQAVLKEHGGY